MSETQQIFSRNRLFWGAAKQARLQHACVLVAGVGGLGCTVAEVLVRAGVGKLILVDRGIIDEPDLNRQILYTLADLGKPKVTVAAERLAAIHQQTEIIPLNLAITDAPEFFEIMSQHHCDGIADCLDNFQSRFVLEQLLTADTFLVHGGVQHDYGQITTIKPTRTRALRELFATIPEAASPIPVCPGIVVCVATLMAHETLNNLWDAPELVNTLLIVELADFSFAKIALA